MSWKTRTGLRTIALRSNPKPKKKRRAGHSRRRLQDPQKKRRTRKKRATRSRAKAAHYRVQGVTPSGHLLYLSRFPKDHWLSTPTASTFTLEGARAVMKEVGGQKSVKNRFRALQIVPA